jgi:hypothetical protein
MTQIPDNQLLYISGLLIPLIYILLYLVGGALRPKYSHIRNSVSELLTPGAPNKKMLMVIQIFYALLYMVFGYGVLLLYSSPGNDYIIGNIGAWMIMALGFTTVGTVIFAQDAEGTPQTWAGLLHKILVFGGLIPLSILSMLFIGLWFRHAKLFPGFDMYSFISLGAVVLMGIIGGATVETPYAGLVERIAALVTQQWFFVLALFLFLH